MKLNWYFDFISPFAYLQHCQFNQLPKDIEVSYKPMLFAGLLKHWGNIGPAEIPPKRIFTYKHCYWLAKKHRIPFIMPPAHPFNSLAALRLAIACNSEAKAIQIIFETIWKHGFALESEQAIVHLEKQLGLKNISELITNQAVKEKLKTNTEEAANRNIFGVPTFSITNQSLHYENFWGFDSFDMMLDYVASPDRFYDDQMKQIEKLPEGIQRKR